jgi:hypothetical protein
MCVADSTFPRQCLLMVIFVNPIWRGVLSGDSVLSVFLSPIVTTNSSLFLLTEIPCRIPFVCLNPVNDFQDLWLSLFVQSLTDFLVIPAEMPQVGSGPIKGLLNPYLVNWSVLPLIRFWPGKIWYFKYAPTENSSSVLFSVWHARLHLTWHLSRAHMWKHFRA